MDILSLPARLALWVIPVMLAVSVHEVAHGIVAGWFGDDTARRQGRLSLNPLRHMDPLGSVVVPLGLLWISGFVFGWARPVPVIPQNLRRPRRDMILVVAAGPLANLLMSLLWAFVMRLGLSLPEGSAPTAWVLVYMGAAGVFINAAIMMLNLLPLPPLDGGRMLAGLLPERLAPGFSRLEPWGFPVVLLAVIAGVAGKVIWPMMVLGMAVATELAGVPVGQLTHALGVMLGVET